MRKQYHFRAGAYELDAWDVDRLVAMDGMHRVARALLEGHSTVLAKRLPVMPEPDYRGVRPEELPY